VSSPLTEPLAQLAEAWRSATGSSRRQLAAAGVAAVVVAALLLARHGTMQARLEAAGAIGGALVVAIGWFVVEARRLRRPDGIVRSLVRDVDRFAAEKVIRALSLLGPDGQARADGTSAELSQLHLTRAIAKLPSRRIVERAERIARRVATGALVVGICALAYAIANTWSVLEGGDVLVASHGQAPVTMRWLDEIEIVARPPEYLHQSEVHEVAMLPLLLPYGTLVTVRAVPTHPGRRLLLTDGTTEVPFVDDGAGAQVARWPLTATTRIGAVARFGDVTIRDPDQISIGSIPDTAPEVTLEGAPRQLSLVDQTEDVPIKYEAIDDHGLREVHLVLRSGTREERRVLSRLDGETRTDKGGLSLKLRDPFLKKSHAPVLVTVEAKDNDPLTGPKWGASEAITIVPPDVGEPEARRLDGLRKLRDALVDTLAWRLTNLVPTASSAASAASGTKTFVDDERARGKADDKALDDTLAQSYAGVKVPDRLRALLRAQQQKTRAAMDAEARAPSAATHTKVVAATERYVLVVDAVIRGSGFKDARDAAKQLADVADDLAFGAQQSRDPEHGDARARGGQRMDAATFVLAGGSRSMMHLGSLGRDIGEIIEADLLRVKRARDGDDATHAELAARDLAARLREPDPSFGSKGSVGRGGGESGGGRGSPGDDPGGDSGDEVDRAQQEAEQDLERLAQEHAGEIAKMEQALNEAASDDDLKAMREEARKHADAVREAVKDLPTVGQGSDSWTSKGAAARELGEQMAKSLEELRPADATQSGRSAMGALDEGKKMLQKQAWLEDPTGEEARRVDGARRKLDAEQKWAEEQLAQMRRKAAERARKDLQQGGQEEDKLAERARELGERSRDKGSLPQQAVESLQDAEHAAHQAAQALQQGDADRGLDRQREAQRALEAARQQLQGDENESSTPSQQEGEKGNSRNDLVAIPGAKEHKGPEEFRRRVVQGLGQPGGGSIKDAVRRYAEGLLR
jgi:hypothetical protein